MASERTGGVLTSDKPERHHRAAHIFFAQNKSRRRREIHSNYNLKSRFVFYYIKSTRTRKMDLDGFSTISSTSTFMCTSTIPFKPAPTSHYRRTSAGRVVY